MIRHTITSTGGAISDTFGPVSSITYLDTLLVHVSAAPTTSGVFALALNSALGVAHDTVLYALNLATGSTTDIFASLPLQLGPGDALKVTYTNADARTIGVQLVLRG
jgi:hypothetical protein